MSQTEWDMDEDIDEQPFNGSYMRRMLGYLRPYWKVMSFVVVIVIINMLLSLSEPIILAYIIDKGINQSDLSVVYMMGAVLLGIRFISWGLSWMHTRWINFTGQRILFDLRQSLFNHLQTLSFRFFDGRPAGKIMSRITNDTNAIGELINGGLITIVMEGTHLLGIIIILFWMDWQLALLSFIMLPLLYIIVGRLRPRIESTWKRSRSTMSAINGNLNETIQGMRTIQAFSRQSVNNEKFNAINLRNKGAFMQAIKLESTVYPLVEFVGMLGTCIVVVYGASLVLSSALTLGYLMAFINYLWRFWGPLSALSKVYSQLLSAMASADRIFEILDTEPEVVNHKDALELQEIRGEVKFEHVSFRYEANKPDVLHDVSFAIKPGQRVALVGPTGAGKSTIVNLLMRFYDATSGTVRIDGIDVKDITLQSLRKDMGIVLQDSFIFGGTIEQNLRYGNDSATDEELRLAAASVRLDRVAAQFPEGFATELEERGSKLSAGQRQLLAFGRVLLSDPRILILDEATSSVDMETEQHIQEALKTLLAGRTAFIIAHRLSTIRDADLILVIENGRIAEQGSHHELMKRGGIYANLVDTQLSMQQSVIVQTS